MDAESRRRLAVAEFKLSVIAPAVNNTYTEPTMAGYFRRISQQPLELPDGSKVRVKASTIASWRMRYLKEGFEGLIPRKRSDLGNSRRIGSDLGADIQQLRADNPAMNATALLAMMVKEGYVAEGELSAATMRRWFKAHPMPAGPGQRKDRRAFEAARVNGIWQADTLFGPFVGTPARRAYLQAIIDDKSRKIVAARFVERDNAATFQGTLRMAVASHGVPEKLFVDNGGPYKNDQLSLICGGLGIVLCHAAVRDGAAKGKIERWNRTLRMQFLSTLPEHAKEGIGELNAELAKWVASYNQRAHSSTKQAPAEAFAAEADKLRFVQGGDQALHDAFMNRMTRKVANDATIRIDGKLFDVPMGLIGEKAEVRFMPGDEGDVWLVGADGSLSRIAPTDKHANASAARVKPAYSIDFGQGA